MKQEAPQQRRKPTWEFPDFTPRRRQIPGAQRAHTVAAGAGTADALHALAGGGLARAVDRGAACP
jgi:hypothetical protein